MYNESLACSDQDIPEYTVTNEFCRKHFLIGLLLREVGFALQEDQDIRHMALAVLKNLMAKHSFDDRYADLVSNVFSPYLHISTGILLSVLRLRLEFSFSFLLFLSGETGKNSKPVYASIWDAFGQHA